MRACVRVCVSACVSACVSVSAYVSAYVSAGIGRQFSILVEMSVDSALSVCVCERASFSGVDGGRLNASSFRRARSTDSARRLGTQ